MSAHDTTALAALALEPDGVEPLYIQIYDQVRALILQGRLSAGTRLPSTRALADELGVSRTTTLSAYDQLESEGYIEGRAGSGAYVAAELPETLLAVAPPRPGPAAERPAAAAPGQDGRLRPFDAGLPDTRGFPFKDWSRHLAQSWRAPSPAMLHIQHSRGDAALRAAIARHVRAVRGVECTAEQVIVTSGAAESIAILARALFRPGDACLIEDPCYPIARAALERSGLEPVPADVDEEGMTLDAAKELPQAPRAALVTPSRQYPLGITMSVSRRLELLNWANETGALVIEDDYDSEYRYTGRPLAALMSLDQGGRVIYLGSFSKIMFRSLRLAYLIAPQDLMPRLESSLAEQPSQASLVPQQALAAFMESGTFAQHVRRSRRLYGERHALLHALVAERLGAHLTASRTESGMHLTAFFTPALERRMSDVQASESARARGLTLAPLSVHYCRRPPRAGFLMGFAGFDRVELTQAVGSLAALLDGLP